VEGLSQGEWPGFAKETTMLKCIGLTALATAVAVLTLGCAGGIVSPAAPVQDQIYRDADVGTGGDHFARGHGSVARLHYSPAPVR
jgi:hypothetical protein